jgi:hypothetical protein
MVLPSQFLPRVKISMKKYCKWYKLAEDASCKFDFHVSAYYVCYFFVRFEILVAVVMKNSVFWDIKQSSVCYLPHAGFLPALFFNPEDKVTYSLETSVNFQWPAWCFVPEVRPLCYFLVSLHKY